MSAVRAILGKRPRPYFYGTWAGIAMFLAVEIVDALMFRFHLRREATFLDNFLLAALAAVLVMSLELQHRREIRRQQQRISLIIELNHHIRNALQSIVYVNAKNHGEDAVIVRDATKRIEWALTEILPGDEPISSPSSPESKHSSLLR